MQANVVTRGRLACEGSACPLPCGGHELDIALLFRLSPKAALNLLIVENHTRHEGGYAKNPSMEEAYDDCKPTKRILLVCKDLYVI
jgi:hypothetical protein